MARFAFVTLISHFVVTNNCAFWILLATPVGLGSFNYFRISLQLELFENCNQKAHWALDLFMAAMTDTTWVWTTPFTRSPRKDTIVKNFPLRTHGGWLKLLNKLHRIFLKKQNGDLNLSTYT